MEESKRENKQESTQELLELGASTTKSSKGNIYTLTIIGQIEGPPDASRDGEDNKVRARDPAAGGGRGVGGH